MAHGGAENGRLQVTRRQFEEWGVHRDAVAPALRELTALGFLEVTEKGHAGVGGNGAANRFRLTYVASKYGIEPSNEWRRIPSLEDAERLAKGARSEKERRARDLGSRGGRATQRKFLAATETMTAAATETMTEI